MRGGVRRARGRVRCVCVRVALAGLHTAQGRVESLPCSDSDTHSLARLYSTLYTGTGAHTRPLSRAPYPVVVFAHGWFQLPEGYKTILEHVASHGYIVIGSRANKEGLSLLLDGTLKAGHDMKTFGLGTAASLSSVERYARFR